MDLDLSVEISALEHVFGPFQDDVGTLASSRKLTLNLTPYTGEDDKLFVYMDITFYIGQLYPDAPPKVEVASSRGLSDDRIRTVLQAMLEEAQQLTGEHMLMSMCMAAKEALSQLNHPEGVHCHICDSPIPQHAQRLNPTLCFSLLCTRHEMPMLKAVAG